MHCEKELGFILFTHILALAMTTGACHNKEPLWRATMDLTIETEQETDGRWLAEVPELPGVLAYGETASEAMSKAEILALRVLAEKLEHGEAKPQAIRIVVNAA